MTKKTMVVAGVTFRHSGTFSDGVQGWQAKNVTLEKTTRGNWVAYISPYWSPRVWSSCVCKTPEEALTEARRSELRAETKRHERELKRIARELGTEE